jgi:hypothetical protein
MPTPSKSIWDQIKDQTSEGIQTFKDGFDSEAETAAKRKPGTINRDADKTEAQKFMRGLGTLPPEPKK